MVSSASKINIGKSINELNVKAYDLIFNSGNVTGNRNEGELGKIYVEYDVNNVLLDPRKRHLNLKGRNSNIFALIGETIWVLAGREDVEYLMNFIPRAINYSDDGKTWRAAYGDRMYAYEQLQGIEKIFKTDGKYTRRATLTIYDPAKDSPKGLKDTYGLDNTLDIPCNQWLQFYVDADDNFNLKVIQRSGDAIWGAMSINVTEFSLLHECMYQIIKNTYPEIKLGIYNHSVTNFHLYENTSSQAREVLKHNDHPEETETMEIFVPQTVQEMKDMFYKISEDIERGVYGNVELSDDNLLKYYYYFSALYVRLKKEGYKGKNKKELELPEPFRTFYFSNNGFAMAMRDSKFRNFEVK